MPYDRTRGRDCTGGSDRAGRRDRTPGWDCTGGSGCAGGADRGQVAIEYLGFLPVLLLVALAAIQMGLIAYVAQQAGTAARAGARAASLHQSAQGACTEAVSSWLTKGTTCVPANGGDTVTVTATVHIPSLIPVWNDAFGDARKTATMPLDH